MDPYRLLFIAFSAVSILCVLLTAVTCSIPSRLGVPGALLTAWFAWCVVAVDVLLFLGPALGEDGLDSICTFQAYGLVFLGNVAMASWGLRAVVGHLAYFQPLVPVYITDRRAITISLLSGLFFVGLPTRFFPQSEMVAQYQLFCYWSNQFLGLHLSTFVIPMFCYTSLAFSLGLYAVFVLLRLRQVVYGSEREHVALSITRQLVLNFVFTAIFVLICFNQVWGCIVYPDVPPLIVSMFGAVGFAGTGIWVFLIIGLTRRNLAQWRELMLRLRWWGGHTQQGAAATERQSLTRSIMQGDFPGGRQSLASTGL